MSESRQIDPVRSERTATPAIALLRLLHLVSPALPVGAYAYSQGLEYAVGESWVFDEESTYEWLQGISAHAVASLDLPLLLRLYRAWDTNDEVKIRQWTARLIASRETQESRGEELHLGHALACILVELDVPAAERWEKAKSAFATLFALAAVRWSISERETLSGYLWAWTENQVLAAVKLVPLGQSAGQRLLFRLAQAMPALVDRATAVRDDELASSATSQLMASALHETQYSRLFRS